MRWVYVLRVYVQKLAPLLHYYITDWMFHCLGVFDSFQRTFCDIWVDFMRLYNNLLWYSYLEIFLLILTWTSPSHINTPVSFSNWMLSVLWKGGPTADPVYVSLHNILPIVFHICLLTVNFFYKHSITSQVWKISHNLSRHVRSACTSTSATCILWNWILKTLF